MHLACQPLLKRLTGDKRSHKVLEAVLDLNMEALLALDMLKVRLCASTCVYDGLIEKKKNRWNIETRKIYNAKEKKMRLSACLCAFVRMRTEMKGQSVTPVYLVFAR